MQLNICILIAYTACLLVHCIDGQQNQSIVETQEVKLMQRKISFKTVGAKGLVDFAIGIGTTIIDAIFPDQKHQELLDEFRKLREAIEASRNHLASEIRYLQYLEHLKIYLSNIQTLRSATETTWRISKNTGYIKDIEKKKLREYCAAKKCEDALNNLLRGLTKAEAKLGVSTTILDEYYDLTRGNPGKVEQMTKELKYVITGGLTSIVTYETLQHGKTYANHFAQRFHRKISDAFNAMSTVNYYSKLCKNPISSCLYRDLEAKMRRPLSNEATSHEILKHLSAKYDRLIFIVLVYNEISGYDKHAYGGYNMFTKLNINGKNALLFYMQKSRSPSGNTQKNRDVIIAATKHKQEGWWWAKPKPPLHRNALTVYNNIVGKVSTWGRAVIKRNVDLRMKHNGGQDLVFWYVGPEFTVCVVF